MSGPARPGGRVFVLVGGGQAASVAARTLRRSGYDGRLIVVGEEADRPYQRPPLSKEYLESGDRSALELAAALAERDHTNGTNPRRATSRDYLAMLTDAL